MNQHNRAAAFIERLAVSLKDAETPEEAMLYATQIKNIVQTIISAEDYIEANHVSREEHYIFLNNQE